MTENQFIERACRKNPKADIETLKMAFAYSRKAHKGQKRISGDDYFTHPLAVAIIVTDLGLDSETVAAALLHDVVEDTDITIEQLKNDFSSGICQLVDGVTKLGEVDFDKYSHEKEYLKDSNKEVESLRKLFLATAKDTRVVFIKLADRLHNMRTLSSLAEADRKRIAKETFDIFAPLADRLSMGQMKAELEDLAFFHCMPDKYREVKKKVKKGITEGKKYLPKIKKSLSNTLAQDGIEAEIDGRVKHLYSVYKKLLKYDGDIDKIYDIMAVRIIVKDVDDCYKTLGIVHSQFKPLIYKIKDYIALPKLNGYRSLHTTVFGVDGKITEIQIRTHKMHDEAENGVAAHWKYSEGKEKIYATGGVSLATKQELKIAKDLKNFSSIDAGRFKAQTLEIFSDRIFVFSPKGDIFELPEGATSVDFAYSVHSGIAEKCIGAKVNGKIVPLDTKLENRDIVEVVASKKSLGPSRDWLHFVVTPKAKQSIRAFLRQKDKDQNIILGHELLDEELKILAKPKVDAIPKELWQKVLEKLPQKNKEDILAGIGDGSVSVKRVARRLFPPEKIVKIIKGEEVAKKISDSLEKEGTIVGGKGLKINIATCCKPAIKDRIVGYITKGKGITVHKTSCKNVINCDKRRLIDVKWETEEAKPNAVKFSMLFVDRRGILKEVTTLVADMGVNIVSLETKPSVKDGYIRVVLKADVGGVLEKRILKEKLSRIKGLEKLS